MKANGHTINRVRRAEVAVQARPVDEDQFLLVREMHYRLANTLTVLACLARFEFAGSAPAPLQDSLARFEARIAAFDKLNRILSVGADREREARLLTGDTVAAFRVDAMAARG